MDYIASGKTLLDKIKAGDATINELKAFVKTITFKDDEIARFVSFLKNQDYGTLENHELIIAMIVEGAHEFEVGKKLPHTAGDSRLYLFNDNYDWGSEVGINFIVDDNDLVQSCTLEVCIDKNDIITSIEMYTTIE